MQHLKKFLLITFLKFLPSFCNFVKIFFRRICTGSSLVDIKLERYSTSWSSSLFRMEVALVTYDPFRWSISSIIVINFAYKTLLLWNKMSLKLILINYNIQWTHFLGTKKRASHPMMLIHIKISKEGIWLGWRVELYLHSGNIYINKIQLKETLSQRKNQAVIGFHCTIKHCGSYTKYKWQ